MPQIRDIDARRRLLDLQARVATLEANPHLVQSPARTIFNTVVTAVCDEFECGIGLVFGESRASNAAIARMTVYWAAHQVLGLSTPRIGRLMGRDHSTVISGCRRITEIAAGDPVLSARLARLKQRLAPPQNRSDA